MGATEQATKRRPFHETVVDAIRQATASDLEFLAELIKATKIPKGHDEIVAAWKQRSGRWWPDEDFGVPTDLLEQKEEAAEEEKAKAKEREQAEAVSS